LPVSFFGGNAPPGGLGMFSAIKFWALRIGAQVGLSNSYSGRQVTDQTSASGSRPKSREPPFQFIGIPNTRWFASKKAELPGQLRRMQRSRIRLC
jgi:hypothetical protein